MRRLLPPTTGPGFIPSMGVLPLPLSEGMIRPGLPTTGPGFAPPLEMIGVGTVGMDVIAVGSTKVVVIEEGITEVGMIGRGRGGREGITWRSVDGNDEENT